MARSKFCIVKNAGYRFEFLVTKFTKKDEKALKLSGWRLSNRLTCMVKVGPHPELAMSEFDYPPYDLVQRGGMGVNQTTKTVAQLFRNMKFKDIPDEMDLGQMDTIPGADQIREL